jgi:Sec-independent protein translocase protein TatA
MQTPLAIFETLGFPELLVVALAAVLVFGKRLPEVAARGYVQLQRTRRALSDMWRETGIDEEVRRVKRDVERSMPRDLDPTPTIRREMRSIERTVRAGPRPLEPTASTAKAEETTAEPANGATALASTAGGPAAERAAGSGEQRSDAEAPTSGAAPPRGD